MFFLIYFFSLACFFSHYRPICNCSSTHLKITHSYTNDLDCSQTLYLRTRKRKRTKQARYTRGWSGGGGMVGFASELSKKDYPLPSRVFRFALAPSSFAILSFCSTMVCVNSLYATFPRVLLRGLMCGNTPPRLKLSIVN